jgi:hypothetical protein
MEISDLKKKIIFRINTSDENTLLAVDQVLDNLEQSQEDFFKTLTPEVHELLLKSLKQIENGEVYTNDQVREMTRKKYGFKR